MTGVSYLCLWAERQKGRREESFHIGECLWDDGVWVEIIDTPLWAVVREEENAIPLASRVGGKWGYREHQGNCGITKGLGNSVNQPLQNMKQWDITSIVWSNSEYAFTHDAEVLWLLALYPPGLCQDSALSLRNEIEL